MRIHLNIIGRLILLQHWINISERDQVAIRRMLSVDVILFATVDNSKI